MKRGTKPAPTALKLLKGTQKSRVNHAEPAALPGWPDCPGHFDDVARQEWASMTELLKDSGILSRTDAKAVAAYCTVYSQWREALADIRENGIFASSELGATKKSPAVQVANDCVTQMLRILVEFGFTPSSRSRVMFHGPQAVDPLTEFLGKRKA